MRKEKFKIQVGDTLYEPSIMYGKVIKHKVVNVFLEDYVSGWKTMIVTESYLGRYTKFCTDVINWFDTAEEAEKALEEKRR